MGLSGRAAFVEAVVDLVAPAHETRSRLTVALVTGEQALTRTVTEELRRTAGVTVYAVGTRSAAFILPGLGRAGAFGVLARIEVECGLKGRAVELAADEDATELVARLLTDHPVSD